MLTSNILNSNASTTANIVKDNDAKNPNVASQINSNLDTSYYTNTDGSYSKVHNLECSMVNMKHIASVISDALKETESVHSKRFSRYIRWPKGRTRVKL